MGGGDERLRSSWAHALRFTWLHTTHALALLLVIGPALTCDFPSGAVNTTKRIQAVLVRRAAPPRPPVPPPNATPGSQAMKDYSGGDGPVAADDARTE